MSRELGVEPELVPGARGAFEVEADGRTIFSKHATHRFPEPEEIVELLKR